MSDEESFAIGVPGLEPQRPKGGCLYTLAHCVVFVGGLIVGAAVLPDLYPYRYSGQLTACKSNCKNLATALEMYASDNKGCYPGELSALTVGNYLRMIPTCPSQGEVTYTDYRVYGKKLQHFHFSCVGNNHAQALNSYGKSTDNYPAYDSDKGLEDHP